MIVEPNGAIIGNWKTEEYKKLPSGGEQLEIFGQGMILSFSRSFASNPERSARAPGVGHYHENDEQLTIMLEGDDKGVVIMNGKRYPVRPGSHWLAPAGIDHTLDLRESKEDVVILQLFPGTVRPEFKYR